MPRTAGRIRRDEQIIRLGFALRIIRRDKRECPLGSQIGSGRTAVVRGDRKAIFLVFHHPAVRNERIQRVFEIVFACQAELLITNKVDELVEAVNKINEQLAKER